MYFVVVVERLDFDETSCDNDDDSMSTQTSFACIFTFLLFVVCVVQNCVVYAASSKEKRDRAGETLNLV